MKHVTSSGIKKNWSAAALSSEIPECKALLIQLLQKNPAERISLHDLKRNKLFRNFDWNALLSGSLRPPHRPSVPNTQDLLQRRTIKDLRQILAEFEQEGDEEDYGIEGKRRPAANWDDEF